MKRALVIGGGVVLAVIFAAVFVLHSSLDRVVRAAVETYGAEITGTKVRLNEAVISATSGRGVLRGLTMGNPQGFTTASAFRLGEARIAIDLETLGRDTVVIREVAIIAPEITYEVGATGSNIDAIRRNVKSHLGGRAGRTAGGAPGQGAAGDDRGEGKKLVIEDLTVRRGRVKVSATALGGKTMSAPLPDIHLTGIGRDRGGATAGEVLDTLVAAVSRAAGQAVSSLGLEKILGAAGTGGVIKRRARDAEGALKKLFGR